MQFCFRVLARKVLSKSVLAASKNVNIYLVLDVITLIKFERFDFLSERQIKFEKLKKLMKQPKL